MLRGFIPFLPAEKYHVAHNCEDLAVMTFTLTVFQKECVQRRLETEVTFHGLTRSENSWPLEERI